jgi:hypothetical protein
MGRHPTVPEAIRLAEARFPGEAIAPTAIYAFWRDPVERFCSAVEFHKRCLPNSFIQLFPERFVGIEPHPRWFETEPEAVDLDIRAIIDSIPPIDILGALPPPPFPGGTFQPRGGNLSFYRAQSEWLDDPRITVLPFADYAPRLKEVVKRFSWDRASVAIPQINAAAGSLPELDDQSITDVSALYEQDIRLAKNMF